MSDIINEVILMRRICKLIMVNRNKQILLRKMCCEENTTLERWTLLEVKLSRGENCHEALKKRSLRLQALKTL